jgi:hypothetical protein
MVAQEGKSPSFSAYVFGVLAGELRVAHPLLKGAGK